MAQHLARIHGTEEDKVNCPFYFKIGACRHGDRCSRLHHKPAFSRTLLIKHLFPHPQHPQSVPKSKEEQTEDFLCFYEDFYLEFSKFGPLEALHIVDNVNDHLIGHIYVMFPDEELASDALGVMQGRYYDGRRMEVEFSPVTEFREARCRDYDEGHCGRGGFCNFLHVRTVPNALRRSLEEDAVAERRRDEDDRRRRDKEERKASKKRKKEHRREGDSGGDRHRRKRSQSRDHYDDDRSHSAD